MKTKLWGIELEVEYRYYKGYHGAHDSFGGKAGAGPALEPDEPPEIELVEVLHKNESILELICGEAYDALVELCWKDFDSQYPEPDYPDDDAYLGD